MTRRFDVSLAVDVPEGDDASTVAYAIGQAVNNCDGLNFRSIVVEEEIKNA